MKKIWKVTSAAAYYAGSFWIQREKMFYISDSMFPVIKGTFIETIENNQKAAIIKQFLNGIVKISRKRIRIKLTEHHTAYSV
jgi:hypothetical protein